MFGKTMRPRFKTLVLANLLFVLSSFAQERCVVKGVVLDDETTKPVPNVNVIVRGKKMGTTTDSAGYFRLGLPARDEFVLVFSHVAYQKVTRSVSSGAPTEIEFRIFLVPEAIKLQEVVVTGTKQIVPSKAAERRALFSFGGDELERLGEEDMEKALRYMLPDIVRRLEDRMMYDAADFTLYVNGEWKESICLDEIDPFSIRRVLVWGLLGIKMDIDVFPNGLPLRRGKHVILIETKQE